MALSHGRQEAGVNIRVGPDKYVRQARVNLRHFLCARRADTEVLLLRQVMHTNLSRYQLVSYLSSLRGHRPTLLRGRRVPEGRLDSAAPAVRSTTDPDRPLVVVRCSPATLSVSGTRTRRRCMGGLGAAEGGWANSASYIVAVRLHSLHALDHYTLYALRHCTTLLTHFATRVFAGTSLGH